MFAHDSQSLLKDNRVLFSRLTWREPVLDPVQFSLSHMRRRCKTSNLPIKADRSSDLRRRVQKMYATLSHASEPTICSKCPLTTSMP